MTSYASYGEIVLDVPMLTPTGNDLSGRHWRARHRLRKQWQAALWALTILATDRRDGPKPPYDRAEITIERHGWRAVRDVDNLYAGLKPVMDAMVQAGVLVDDSEKVVTSLKIVQVQAPRGTRRTVIRIRPAASGSSSPTSAPALPSQSPG